MTTIAHVIESPAPANEPAPEPQARCPKCLGNHAPDDVVTCAFRSLGGACYVIASLLRCCGNKFTFTAEHARKFLDAQGYDPEANTFKRGA